jgi:hypothetical protein
MNTRPDKPKDYFSKLLDMPENEIDYSEIPLTSKADWAGAEVLLPITMEEFKKSRGLCGKLCLRKRDDF